uniref:Glycosyltransferase n=1 Tax=Fagus sylvatica TaxID=28930 RepID=A0A2N9GBL5_FAGSY
MSMTQSQSATDPHVAVLAFPFTCHPWSLFNLACKLASAAPQVRFSFFNTSKSNRRLFSTSQLAELPDNLKAYNVADGVPEGHVFTPANLDVEEFELFMKAAPESFGKAMDIAVGETGRNISCLLSDCLFVFSCQMAEKMHAKWVSFWVPAPCSLLAHMYRDLIHKAYTNYACGINGGGVVGLGCIKPIEKSLDVIPGLSAMRFCDLPDDLLQSDVPNSSLLFNNMCRMREVLPQASAVVMNSFQELNSTLLTNDLKSKFQDLLYLGIPTLTLPPTPPPPPSHSDATGCLPWLEQKKPSSVAYISFGTLAPFPPNEFVALAEALEVSGVPFLWSLKDNLKQLLPNGFVQRTSASMQGKIVAWAPQSQVLAHSAVGVYVTHCGYNSVFESIVGEVPMICRPIWADNKMNGQMVEEVWGIGVRVEGGVLYKEWNAKELGTRSRRT